MAIRHPRRIALAAALALLGASLVLDVLKPGISARPSVEEAFKFLGILCWAVFSMRAGIDAVPASARRPVTPPRAMEEALGSQPR